MSEPNSTPPPIPEHAQSPSPGASVLPEAGPPQIEKSGSSTAKILIVILLGGGFLIFGLVAVCGIGSYFFLTEIAKAQPIPGITVEVDTGNARDGDELTDTVHAYLNRRLRSLGYDEKGLEPLTVQVSLVKIGEEEYQDSMRRIYVDRVKLVIEFIDDDGELLKTVEATPEVRDVEEVQFDAEIEMNRASYSRAVGQILRMELPTPDEL